MVPPAVLGTIASKHICMSDTSIELLQLQVQQLLIRVDILEKKVGELEKGRHDDFELVSAAARAPSPSRTSSSSSSYNALALEIPDLPSEALWLCGGLRGGKLSFQQRALRAWQVQGVGADPVCPCTCCRCSRPFGPQWSQGLSRLAHGGSRSGEFGWQQMGIGLQDDASTGAAVAAVGLSQPELRSPLEKLLLFGSSAMDLLERDGLHSDKESRGHSPKSQQSGPAYMDSWAKEEGAVPSSQRQKL